MIRTLVSIPVLIAVVAFTQGCQKTEQPDKAELTNLKKLEEASETRCSNGSKLALTTREVRLFQDMMPTPILFAFQKGSSRCADFANAGHSGSSTWLEIKTNPDCIPNGALFEIERYAMEGTKVYLDLKPIDGNDPSRVKIYTSLGYELTKIREKLGMETYICN